MDLTEKQIKGVLDECTLFYKGVVFRQGYLFKKKAMLHDRLQVQLSWYVRL